MKKTKITLILFSICLLAGFISCEKAEMFCFCDKTYNGILMEQGVLREDIITYSDCDKENSFSTENGNIVITKCGWLEDYNPGDL